MTATCAPPPERTPAPVEEEDPEERVREPDELLVPQDLEVEPEVESTEGDTSDTEYTPARCTLRTYSTFAPTAADAGTAMT